MPQRNYMLEFTLSSLPCQLAAITPEFEVEKGDSYHLHRHPTFELHAVLSGSMEIRVGQQEHVVQVNRGVLIRPGIYHTICSYSDNLSKICISFLLPEPESTLLGGGG